MPVNLRMGMFISQIREDNKKGVYVENLKEMEVTSAREVMLQLIQVCDFLSCHASFVYKYPCYESLYRCFLW